MQSSRAASQPCGFYTCNGAAQLCLGLAFSFSDFSCAVIVVVRALNKFLETFFYRRKGRRSWDLLTFFWYVIFTLAFSTYIAGCRAHDFRCREHEFALRCESMYIGRLKYMLCLILVRLRSAACEFPDTPRRCCIALVVWLAVGGGSWYLGANTGFLCCPRLANW